MEETIREYTYKNNKVLIGSDRLFCIIKKDYRKYIDKNEFARALLNLDKSFIFEDISVDFLFQIMADANRYFNENIKVVNDMSEENVEVVELQKPEEVGKMLVLNLNELNWALETYLGAAGIKKNDWKAFIRKECKKNGSVDKDKYNKYISMTKQQRDLDIDFILLVNKFTEHIGYPNIFNAIPEMSVRKTDWVLGEENDLVYKYGQPNITRKKFTIKEMKTVAFLPVASHAKSTGIGIDKPYEPYRPENYDELLKEAMRFAEEQVEVNKQFWTIRKEEY